MTLPTWPEDVQQDVIRAGVPGARGGEGTGLGGPRRGTPKSASALQDVAGTRRSPGVRVAPLIPTTSSSACKPPENLFVVDNVEIPDQRLRQLRVGPAVP